VVLINGMPVVWMSKRQRTVALSSAEAEYMALADGVKEAMWVQNLPSNCKRQHAVTYQLIPPSQHVSIMNQQWR
jgi:hypothetical protein